MGSQELFNFPSATISQLDPDDLRWRAQENTHVAEVNIFRDDDVIILSSVIPNSSVWDRTKPYFVNMLGRWEEV